MWRLSAACIIKTKSKCESVNVFTALHVDCCHILLDIIIIVFFSHQSYHFSESQESRSHFTPKHITPKVLNTVIQLFYLLNVILIINII